MTTLGATSTTTTFPAVASDVGAQPVDSDLTAIAALTTTSFGRGLLELANQAALLSAAGAQASDSDLTAIAALSPSNDDLVQRKAGAWTNRTIAQLLTDLAAAGTTFQPLDSDLTAIAALTTTSYGRALLALADAAAGRTALGLGTAALSASGDFQPIDSDLTAIAALTTTSFGRSVLAAADAAALRTLAGLGTLATQSGTFSGTSSGTNTGDQVASGVPFTPNGSIAATDVQSAIQEVRDEAGGSGLSAAKVGARATYGV